MRKLAVVLAIALAAAACTIPESGTTATTRATASPTAPPTTEAATTTTEAAATTAPPSTAVPTTTVAPSDTASLDVMRDTSCGKWDELGTAAELRQVVINNPTYEWGALRDFNSNGEPCESYLGVGYMPTTTTAAPPSTTTAQPSTTEAAETTTTVPPETTTTTQPTTTTTIPTLTRGMYEVGVDIQPGRHRLLVGGYCYWERLSGFSGEFSDIIANDNISGRFFVEIRSSDVGFNLDC